MEDWISQATENKARERIRRRALHAIESGYAADADRLEAAGLPTAHTARVRLLNLMETAGIKVSEKPYPLSDGSAVVCTSLPLGKMLEFILGDERLPEGSIGKITPNIPSLLPSGPASLEKPLWMGDLRSAQEDATAALAAAAKAWWWAPLYSMYESGELKSAPDIVRTVSKGFTYLTVLAAPYHNSFSPP